MKMLIFNGRVGVGLLGPALETDEDNRMKRPLVVRAGIVFVGVETDETDVCLTTAFVNVESTGSVPVGDMGVVVRTEGAEVMTNAMVEREIELVDEERSEMLVDVVAGVEEVAFETKAEATSPFTVRDVLDVVAIEEPRVTFDAEATVETTKLSTVRDVGVLEADVVEADVERPVETIVLVVTTVVMTSDDVPIVIVVTKASVTRLPVVAKRTAVVVLPLLTCIVDELLEESVATVSEGETNRIAFGKGVSAVI